MDDFQILVDLHKENQRLGPGSDEYTRLALELSGLKERSGLRVADIGCGTGASTLVLAEELDAEITAVDLFPEFLAELEGRAATRKLRGRIELMEASMEELPFVPDSLDAIWSEGAVYNLGFEQGVETWAPFLKQGGVIALSEITWLTSERPAELQEHWDEAYPEVNLASAKISVLEKHGFTPIGYFPLPTSCWLEGYYRPLRERIPELLARYGNSEQARACVEAEEREIALYERNQDFVSYGFYIARKS